VNSQLVVNLASWQGFIAGQNSLKQEVMTSSRFGVLTSFFHSPEVVKEVGKPKAERCLLSASPSLLMASEKKKVKKPGLPISLPIV